MGDMVYRVMYRRKRAWVSPPFFSGA